MSQKIFWISPAVSRGKVEWPKCEATFTTEESLKRRVVGGASVTCGCSAKVSYEGQKLCTRHAQFRALNDLIGDGQVCE